MRIVTYQERLVRGEGGEIEVKRHRYLDDPASMGTALVNMLVLSEEEGCLVGDIDRAMGLLGGLWYRR